MHTTTWIKLTLMIKACYGIIAGENLALLKSECLPFVSVGSDLYTYIFLFVMSAEQNMQNLVYTGSFQRGCYLHCSIPSFWFGYSDYFKTLNVFLTCLHVRNKAFHTTVR